MPLTPAQLLKLKRWNTPTIANALGLQHDLVVMSPSGRPFKFADKGAPVADVFA